MKQIKLQKHIDNIKHENELLKQTVKDLNEKIKSMPITEQSLRKSLKKIETPSAAFDEYVNDCFETPTKNYYIPVPILSSQSGHNTDSDFTETITRKQINSTGYNIFKLKSLKMVLEFQQAYQ